MKKDCLGVQVNNSILTQESERVVTNNEVENEKVDFRSSDPELKFLDEKFDGCIVGVDRLKESVIYHKEDMINILMDEIDNDPDWEGQFECWEDQYDYCMERVYDNFNSYGEEVNGTPTLMEIF